MKIVQLDSKKHNRSKFDCGVIALNNYLRQMANQQSKKDNTRTYVLEYQNDKSIIVGFYTLTMTSIDLKALTGSLLVKHKNASSAGLIARLAIDKKYKAKGLGQWLLISALNKMLSASDVVGFPLIVVDAKDGAKEFYLKFGFKAFQSSDNKLFITIADVRKSLNLIVEK